MDRHFAAVMARPDVSARVKRQFKIARAFGRLPNSYMQYYYFREETIAEAQAAPLTRAQAILAELPGYYRHFREQIEADEPQVTQGRGGSVFGDMAVEVLRGLAQRHDSLHTLNVRNRGALPDLAPERIVEVPARLEARSASPVAQDRLPSTVTGLLRMLAEYQWLAAEASWNGDRRALELALASNPLVLSLPLARSLLDDVIPLQQDFLPAQFKA
jgi:6-phospho-beta-glucosidase